MKNFKINNNMIGDKQKIYFIADIAANHDGKLERAIKLIDLAKESGADAAKFQHHDVKKYVRIMGLRIWGRKVIKKMEESILKFIRMLRYQKIGLQSLRNIVIKLRLILCLHHMI